MPLHLALCDQVSLSRKAGKSIYGATYAVCAVRTVVSLEHGL